MADRDLGKVDPPPLRIPIVDERGYPTIEMTAFLTRLWSRVADPSGNVIDRAADAAAQAERDASLANNLSGSLQQQLIQIAQQFDEFQGVGEGHIQSRTEHGVKGRNVGTEDFATQVVAGVVKQAASMEEAEETSAEPSSVEIAAAPSSYNQAYIQGLAEQVNGNTQRINQVIADFNAAVEQLNSWRQKLIDAGIVHD